MRIRQFKRGLVAGVILGFLFAFLLWRFSYPIFSSRWRNLKDGMTQEQVRQKLGSPTWTGQGIWIGAGDQRVIRWQYRRAQMGRWVNYCVEFDYIGPAGTPVVFRREKCFEDWDWPDWPYRRAKAR